MIEIKRSLSPKVGRGFHSACADLALQHPDIHKWVVYPGDESFALHADVRAVPLATLLVQLQNIINPAHSPSI